jgi:integrase
VEQQVAERQEQSVEAHFVDYRGAERITSLSRWTLNPSNLRQRSFAPLLKRAGLPHIRFHDLRHTCATLLLSKGVHPKFVQELLGHATIAITLDTYSHVLPGMGGEAAIAMEDALSGDH